jgi:hypothetical protein
MGVFAGDDGQNVKSKLRRPGESELQNHATVSGKKVSISATSLSEAQLAGPHYSFGLTRIAGADDGSGDGGMV